MKIFLLCPPFFWPRGIIKKILYCLKMWLFHVFYYLLLPPPISLFQRPYNAAQCLSGKPVWVRCASRSRLKAALAVSIESSPTACVLASPQKERSREVRVRLRIRAFARARPPVVAMPLEPRQACLWALLHAAAQKAQTP